jgi:hypothetical protein
VLLWKLESEGFVPVAMEFVYCAPESTRVGAEFNRDIYVPGAEIEIIAPYMAEEHANAFDWMIKIKKAIDPYKILNPGKIFPLENSKF